MKKSNVTSQRSIIFGKRLESFRLRRGFSIKKTAKLIGVADSTYFDWEHGKSILGEPYLEIARAFDITLDELFGISEADNNSIEDRLDRIIFEVQSLKLKILENSE